MKLSRKKLSLAALICTLPLIASCSKGDVYEWGNKYTVTVETPSGEVSGVSVVGEKLIDRQKNPQFGSGNVWGFSLNGEAAVLDLGKTPKGPRYLFALVVRNQYLPFRIAGEVLDIPISRYADIAGKFDQVDWPVELPRNSLPLMVTFGNVNNPASVKRVDPDDLDAAFGLCPDGSGLKNRNAPWRAKKMSYKEWLMGRARRGKEYKAMKSQSSYSGVALENILKRSYKPRNTSADCHRLKSITLEITNEPVTTGKVEEVLGWLKSVGSQVGGLTKLPKGKRTRDYPDPEVQFLSPAAFSTEWNK